MGTLTLANIAAYSAQVLCIVALATLVWALLRIDDGRYFDTATGA